MACGGDSSVKSAGTFSEDYAPLSTRIPDDAVGHAAVPSHTVQQGLGVTIERGQQRPRVQPDVVVHFEEKPESK